MYKYFITAINKQKATSKVFVKFEHEIEKFVQDEYNITYDSAKFKNKSFYVDNINHIISIINFKCPDPKPKSDEYKIPKFRPIYKDGDIVYYKIHRTEYIGMIKNCEQGMFNGMHMAYQEELKWWRKHREGYKPIRPTSRSFLTFAFLLKLENKVPIDLKVWDESDDWEITEDVDWEHRLATKEEVDFFNEQLKVAEITYNSKTFEVWYKGNTEEYAPEFIKF